MYESKVARYNQYGMPPLDDDEDTVEPTEGTASDGSDPSSELVNESLLMDNKRCKEYRNEEDDAKHDDNRIV